MKPFAPVYFDVHWYGPFPYDGLLELESPNLVLYMIAGTHGVYGKNVPLYIGMTEQGISDRVSQHEAWLRDELDPPVIYAAAVSEMKCWADISEKDEYPPPPRNVIEEIEGLLIYAHQLAYNVKSKQGGNKHTRDILVFNTGKRSGLIPEVSTMNWYGDTR
jgi:hypothetical protein